MYEEARNEPAFLKCKKRKFCEMQEFVCSDGSLFAHKFVVAAHSKYIKDIMIAADNEDQVQEFLL